MKERTNFKKDKEVGHKMMVWELIDQILAENKQGTITVKNFKSKDKQGNPLYIEAAEIVYKDKEIVQSRMRFNVRPFEVKRKTAFYIPSKVNPEETNYTIYI